MTDQEAKEVTSEEAEVNLITQLPSTIQESSGEAAAQTIEFVKANQIREVVIEMVQPFHGVVAQLRSEIKSNQFQIEEKAKEIVEI